MSQFAFLFLTDIFPVKKESIHTVTYNTALGAFEHVMNRRCALCAAVEMLITPYRDPSTSGSESNGPDFYPGKCGHPAAQGSMGRSTGVIHSAYRREGRLCGYRAVDHLRLPGRIDMHD